MDTKKCNTCGNDRPLSEFGKHPTTKDKMQPKCKRCTSSFVTDLQRMRSCGVDSDKYNEMMDSQGYRCAICGIHTADCKRNLSVDHDHKTGMARGLLCVRCNAGLGQFKDLPGRLRDAADYLEKFS